MRPVTVFEYYRPEGETIYQKRECGKGMFHQFGVSYEEFENSPGQFTTAIVELPTGEVITPDASMIRFDDIGQPGSWHSRMTDMGARVKI